MDVMSFSEAVAIRPFPFLIVQPRCAILSVARPRKSIVRQDSFGFPLFPFRPVRIKDRVRAGVRQTNTRAMSTSTANIVVALALGDVGNERFSRGTAMPVTCCTVLEFVYV